MESQSSWKKHTIFFLASQNISLFGSMLVQYAIMWHITLTTQSGTMMMISIICGFIPTLIISPFAGVWADRLERKKVIILSDAMIAITTLAMAISFYFGFESLWQLFVVMAIRSFGNGIQTPAVSALLPQLVPNEQLTKVNGIQQSIQACVSIISP
ncbi:MAG: MFS transporter, partial [Sphaerochaetaceae bacterium]